MKTKQILLLTLVLAFFNGVNSQQIDYNAKAIKLIPEKSFLSNVDWKALFYDDTKKNIPALVGINKQIAIAPDESVFVLDRMNYSITIPQQMILISFPLLFEDREYLQW